MNEHLIIETAFLLFTLFFPFRSGISIDPQTSGDGQGWNEYRSS